MENKIIVGSAEWCAFPNLAIPAIRAKVDSGAKTSCIHTSNIHQFKKDDIPWVSFDVHPVQKDCNIAVRCEAPIVDKRDIKSSNGTIENRIVIKTHMTLNNENWEIELSLTNRDTMGYRMLLGREAMKGRILIDPGVKNNLAKVSKKKLAKLYGQKIQKK